MTNDRIKFTEHPGSVLCELLRNNIEIHHDRPSLADELDWYKTLSLKQRINLKANCSLIVGMTWEDMGILFTFKEKIDLLHGKLKMEGFDV